MGWFDKNKKQEELLVGKDRYTVCRGCSAHVFTEQWQQNYKVCPQCGYHARLTAPERINLIADAGSFREFASDVIPGDPLKFVDGKGSYADKVAEARAKTGLNETVVTGSASIYGVRVVLAVMDFRFIGGSLSSGAGEKIWQAAEHAIAKKRALLIFSASGGARMHEGVLSLMQMAKTCTAVAKLNKAGCPFISILTDPTTGGVSASFATVGDINIAEPKALIGFAGRRVIEQTIKEKLPPDFQTSEFLLQQGFLDSIVSRNEMKDYLYRVLFYMGQKRTK
jgi:acetyl-CoA carboxylase carboxyl transferase subunit beta